MRAFLTLLLLSHVAIAREAKYAVQPFGKTWVAYEIILDGKVLKSSSVSINTQSQIACAFACNFDPTCVSFNYCDNHLCELNDVEIYSTEDMEDFLVDKPNCRYVGMEKLEVPVCEMNGETDISIISKKLVTWGEWEEKWEHENETDFRQDLLSPVGYVFGVL